MTQKITSENFEELIASGKPIVLDFWATWCGPCRRVGPIIEELANDYEGQVIVGKCDIEEDEDLPMARLSTSRWVLLPVLSSKRN